MKIVVLGSGGIANKAYLPLLCSWPEIDVAGIFSRTQENAEKVAAKWHIQLATNDMHEILKTKPDAAFVLTNNATHFPLALELLKADVDVFVEKPMAETTEQVHQLAETAEKHQRVLMGGFNRRFSLLYEQARQYFIDRHLSMAIVEKHRNVVSHVSLYNNYVDDTIHQIDLIRHICGEVLPLHTQVQMENGKLTGAVSLMKTSQKGLVILLTSLKAGSWQERLTLHGETFTVEVEAFRQLKVKGAEHDQLYGVDRPGKWIEDMKERGFFGAVGHFIDCVQTRKQPLTNGWDVEKTHQLIDKLVALTGEEQVKPNGDWDNIKRWS